MKRWLAMVVLLAGAFLWWDQVRPWRQLQAEYLHLQTDAIERQLAAEDEALVGRLEPLEATLAKEKQLWQGRQQETDALRDQQRAFEQKLYLAQRRQRTPTEDPPSSVDPAASMDVDRREIEGLRALIADRGGKLADLGAGLTAAEKALGDLTARRDSMHEELAQRGRERWLWRGPLTPWAPSIQVREVRPRVVDDTVHTAPVVDRCMTCHLGALDDPAVTDPEETSALYGPHPRLDLYLGVDSPHPYAEFGCTVCHGGDGRATDFRRADHRASFDDSSQAMLPRALLGVACASCHEAASTTREASAEVPSALRSLDQGRQLIFDLGCMQCHVGASDADASETGEPRYLARPAPDLSYLPSKTRPAWLYQWLLEPPQGHPTWTSDLDGLAERQVTAQAMVSTLFEPVSKTRPTTLKTPPSADAAAGQALFEGLGCHGCHSVDSTASVRPAAVRPAAVRPAAVRWAAVRLGPGLGAVGHKLDAAWLFAWLQNPGTLTPQTTMPDFALSRSEAASLSAYLMTLRGGEAAAELPSMDRELRDRLLFESLGRDKTLEQAQAHLDRLDDTERNTELGRRSLVDQGCWSCHGGSDEPTTAPPLHGLNPGNVERLASSHLPELATAWERVGGRPLVSDESVAGTLLEQQTAGLGRRGPTYLLHDDEATALLSALLRTGSSQPVASRRVVASPAMARGEAMVTYWGCRGCHALGGSGGLPGGEASGERAPPLDHIGRRVQADWLDDFLKSPGASRPRPWLDLRMPTFPLSEGQRHDLVQHFLDRDGVSAFTASRPSAQRKDLLVGGILFQILQCNLCHAEQEDVGGQTITELAPDYSLASRRLRPDWVEQWLLDPLRFRPQTSMPVYFGEAGDHDLSYLSGTLDSPMFWVQEQRLRSAFESEAQMETFLLDRRRVAGALREYLWSLGESTNVR